jgi:hypothetical protein
VIHAITRGTLRVKNPHQVGSEGRMPQGVLAIQLPRRTIQFPGTEPSARGRSGESSGRFEAQGSSSLIGKTRFWEWQKPLSAGGWRRSSNRLIWLGPGPQPAT